MASILSIRDAWCLNGTSEFHFLICKCFFIYNRNLSEQYDDSVQ